MWLTLCVVLWCYVVSICQVESESTSVSVNFWSDISTSAMLQKVSYGILATALALPACLSLSLSVCLCVCLSITIIHHHHSLCSIQSPTLMCVCVCADLRDGRPRLVVAAVRPVASHPAHGRGHDDAACAPQYPHGTVSSVPSRVGQGRAVPYTGEEKGRRERERGERLRKNIALPCSISLSVCLSLSRSVSLSVSVFLSVSFSIFLPMHSPTYPSNHPYLHRYMLGYVIAIEVVEGCLGKAKTRAVLAGERREGRIHTRGDRD